MKRAAASSILVSVMLLAVAVVAEAQQPKKVARIGYLAGASRSAIAFRLEAFRQALRELGYVEGKNIAIEYRFSEGNFRRQKELAAELAHLKVDVHRCVRSHFDARCQRSDLYDTHCNDLS